MNTMAWDYWLPDKVTPKPATREVIARLEAVLRQDPSHPGANHALIHLVEAGPDPARGLASADRLRFYAPDAGHLVHMPSHIYMRTGRYHEAALANERAADADLGYIAACRAQGFYPGMYYPHNEHFLWWAYTFEGRKAAAFAKARQVVQLTASPMCGSPLPEKPRLTHLHLLTAVRFGDWGAVEIAPEPPATEALDRVMWHWARATMFAARLLPEAAAREAAAAGELANGEALAAMDNAYLPAITIAAIATRLAEGRALLAQHATGEALEAFRAAVELEDAMPYMEPAFWFYPTRQTLGATLLALGQPAEAAAVFRDDLRVWPENGWSLHGLALALEKLGESAEADAMRARFHTSWAHADIQPSLAMY
jgi:tetratricopeptide (TPR) repeat protein